jgi:hypothetical protein
LAASTTFQLLSSNPLGEGSTGTAAFAGNRIYIRGAKHLFCIGGIRE